MIVVNQNKDEAIVFNKISMCEGYSQSDEIKLEKLRGELEFGAHAINKNKEISKRIDHLKSTMIKVHKIIINDEHVYAVYSTKEQCIEEFNDCIEYINSEGVYSFSKDKGEVK